MSFKRHEKKRLQNKVSVVPRYSLFTVYLTIKVPVGDAIETSFTPLIPNARKEVRGGVTTC